MTAVLAFTAGCGAFEEPAEVVEPDPVQLTSNVDDGATDVGVDTFVEITAENGAVSAATLESSDGEQTVPGEITDTGWVATERLEPGTTYRLSATADGQAGAEELASSFSTQDLTLDDQTYPAVAPLEGETVGVGMPVIVTFDIPVQDRETFEAHMSVTADPPVEGSWSWFSDREAHYRPKEFWPADTEVNVFLDLNGVPAGNGIYGQQDQDIDFTIGRKVVSTVDVGRSKLTYTVDGETVRTIPVSTGAPQWRTREGIKVIMEKFDSVDMDAASTGVDSADPNYYNMEDVKWAMRVTNSGEFLHAAPWNAGNFGRANVSHGCTGMSTADAAWIYQRSRRGDVIEFVNSPRPLEERNGWTDWNVPWDEWVEGSAV